VFSFESWSLYVFLLFVYNDIRTQISIKLLDSSRLNVDLLSYILTWSLFLSTQTVRKSTLENSRYNMTTDSQGVLKKHFCELKMSFLPTSPIQIIWYIESLLTAYRLVNVFSFEIWTTFVFLFCVSKATSTQTSIKFLDYSRFHIGFWMIY
jgi:hypothetical protein